MSSEKPITSRFEENLQFKQVAGPETYSVTTDGPVVYLSVADSTGTVIGYVWANDEDDAAGWVVPPGLSANAVNAAWVGGCGLCAQARTGSSLPLPYSPSWRAA